MMGQLALIASMLFVALLAGTGFVIFLVLNPAGMSPTFYVETMQHAIQVLTAPLLVVGGLAVLFTIVSTFIARSDRPSFYLLIAASICVAAVALITTSGNFPINNQIITWSINSPPSNWMELRDQWWKLHIARSILGIAGLCFLILGTVVRRDMSEGIGPEIVAPAHNAADDD